MADVAANKGTSEHVPFAPPEKWKQWSTVCQAVHNFWIIVGPKLRVRPEQWPRVRLPAPELEPVVVESAEKAVFPAAPCVMGPHQRVVEHGTYAICLNWHIVKGGRAAPGRCPLSLPPAVGGKSVSWNL
eukprot:4432608-Amphidinium_carterae.1